MPHPLILLWLLVGCDTTAVTLSQNCDVRLSGLNPSTAQPGEVVAAEGGPMTQIWDTAVYVDGTRAELLAIDRTGCEACDTCKEESSCEACDDCDACDDICTTECVETVQFIAPENDVGTAQVSMYNGHGQSNSVPLSVTPNTDTGFDSGSVGEPDSGTPVDTGATASTDTADDPSTDTDD